MSWGGSYLEGLIFGILRYVRGSPVLFFQISLLHALFLTTFLCIYRAVIKSRRPEISPSYYECGPRVLLLENRTKRNP